jgi:uncharacterized damage-inducible protein DinB
VIATATARDDIALLKRLTHFHVTQQAFLQIWQSRTLSLPAEDELTVRVRLLEFARRTHVELAAFLDGLEPGRLDDAVELPWSAAPKVTVTLRDTLLQVVLHSQHHRGQAASALRAHGAQPPTVDHLAWVWQGRPEAAWP